MPKHLQKADSEFQGTVTIDKKLTTKSETNFLGTKKFQSFTGTLASIGDGTTAFGDGDVLVELGTLDVTIPSGHVTASKIIVEKAIINVTTAAGQTLVASLHLSSDTGTAANAALANNTEVVGAGVTYVQPQLATVGTEADINMNSAAVTVAGPNLAVAVAKKYLYLVTGTALNADATAGRFTVQLEYTVL